MNVDALEKDFEMWLKSHPISLQEYSEEAKTLAWSAWQECNSRNKTNCEIGYPECERNWKKHGKCYYGSCDD